MLIALGDQEKSIKYKNLYFSRDRTLGYDFRDYKSLKEIFRDIYYNSFSIQEAENMQSEFTATLTALEQCRPRKSEYKKEKLKLLDNAKKLYDGRKIIIDAFKNNLFPLEAEDKSLNVKTRTKIKMNMKKVLLISLTI